MEKFDIAIIGSGPGGYPAAIRAAQLQASVAIVEKAEIGGVCLNRGCIPTKLLLHAADIFTAAGESEQFGITAAPVIDYAKLIERKNATTEKLQNGVATLLKGNGVKVFPGSARFLSRSELEITNVVTQQNIRAEKIIIATGSEPAKLDFIPEHDRVLNSAAFLELTELPKRLLILGGGYIGCEFACMTARLGAEVTIVELLPDILNTLDADVRRAVKAVMTKHLNIKIITGKPLENVSAGKDMVSGRAGEETLEADALLVSVGRKPATEGLNIGAIGLETDDRGFIPVDDTGRTRVSNIYAIGDVNGRAMLAHAATSQGLIVAENAVARKSIPFETLIPSVVFTVPEVGAVGLTETRAKEEGIAVSTGKFYFQALGKGIATGETAGFVKWIAEADTGRVLGAAAVGPRATELVHEAVLAVRSEQTVEELGRLVHAHPTFSEAWGEAAHALGDGAIHAAPKRRSKKKKKK